MSTKGIIGFAGIKTAGNELTHPPGTLLDALNCVLREKDILEPRRGIPLSTYIDNDSGNANANIAKEIYQWGPHLLVHYSGNAGSKLALWRNWATSPVYALIGTLAEPDPTVCRMKFSELVRSLFFTTSTGIYTLDSSTGTARKAGLIEPRFIYVEPDSGPTYTHLSGNPSATGSWMAKNTVVGGRAVVGRRDANDRILLSAPGARMTVVNPNDVTVAIGSLNRTSNVVTATVTGHKFRAKDTFTLSPGEASFAAGTYTIASVTSTTIVYNDTAANATSTVQQTISSGKKSIQWAVQLPSDAAAGDFVRVYRTDESEGEAVDPGDECFLAYERTVTAAHVSAGYVTITDTTPASFLSEPLPTNANTGDGPNIGRNDRPPLMRDVCAWDGRLWGLETTDRHRLLLRVLGVGSPNGLQAGDLIAINMKVYTADTSFLLHTTFLPTENVDKSTMQFAAYANAQAATTGIVAFQRFDGDTGLGEVLFEQRDLADTLAHNNSGAINAIYAATSRESAFGDPLATLKLITEASSSRTGSTVTIRCTGHGFSAGQVIMIAFTSGVDTNFPPGLKTVATVVDANNFTYTEAGSATTMSVSGEYYAYATTHKGKADRSLLRYSKQDEPESWPLPFAPAGFPDGAEGYRIAPLPNGGGLVVALKDGGFYLVSGSYPYSVEPLDKTADLVAPDTLKEHGGSLFGLTSHGLAMIGSGGVVPVSADIDDTLRLLVARIRDGSVPANIPWATSYQSENQLLLATPINAGLGVMASYVEQQFVFHSTTGMFTRWSGRRTCGLVWRGGDYLVMGDYYVNRLRKELKTMVGGGDVFGLNDYRDDTLSIASGVFSSLGSNNWRYTASGLGSVSIGDVLVYSSNPFRVVAVGSGYIDVYDPVGVLSATTTAATIYLGFDVTIKWAGDPSGAPGVESRWRQLQLHFKERLFDKLLATFKGEKSDTTETVTLRGQPSDTNFAWFTPVSRVSTVRGKVPDGLERVAIQTITLTMHEAFGFFRLLGRSSSSQSVTERTGQ